MISCLPQLGFTLGGVLLGLFVPAVFTSPAKPTTTVPAFYFKPLCDLQVLNSEYADALTYQRQLAATAARPVLADPNQLFGTVLHNQRIAEKDSLHHDYLTFHAELVGTLIDADEFRSSPRKLAHYIWNRFNNSPHHAIIQRDTSLRYVSISCSNRYFVVRLDDHPSIRIKEQYERYRQWQLHSATAGK